MARIYEITKAKDVSDRIAALDLAKEAREALGRGERISFVVDQHPASGVRVETLVIHAPGGVSGDVGRAGQALGGPAVWGDWHEDDGGFLEEDETGELIFTDGTISEEAR